MYIIWVNEVLWIIIINFGGFRRFLFCLFMELIYIWWMKGIFIKIYLQIELGE